MDDHLLRFQEDTEYVFLDCETENLCLNREHNLPWQIGMIKMRGNKKIAEAKDPSTNPKINKPLLDQNEFLIMVIQPRKVSNPSNRAGIICK